MVVKEKAKEKALETAKEMGYSHHQIEVTRHEILEVEGTPKHYVDVAVRGNRVEVSAYKISDNLLNIKALKPESNLQLTFVYETGVEE